MSITTENNKRIARNTIMLYIRQIVTLLIGLYTVRVVLDVLGVEDYGIYNTVAGVVGLLGFLSETMASASQRFFSFALGQNDRKQIQMVFSVNFIIYLAIAVVALVLFETLGLWFVNEKLVVPPERYEASCTIYHYAVMTFVVMIMRSPFMALIIAHEDMQIYAYMSILEAVLKLGIVYLLVFINFDKLELYGTLVFIITMLTTLIYVGIALKKYRKYNFKINKWNKTLFKEITDFTGWTMFGQLTNTLRHQAVTVLLNQVFNPLVVAARTIATSVSGQINVFANGFNTSLYPPIIKYYAANEKQNMFSLIYNGSKITFFLMWILALPLFLEMETVLNIWLKDVPQYAVLFTKLTIIESVIFSISMPLTTAARAPGRMKIYELTLGTIQILIFVFSWIVLKLGAAAYSVFIVAIIANIVMFFVRLIIVSKLIQLPKIQFFRNVVIPIMGVSVVSFILSYTVHSVLPDGIVFAIISILASVIFCAISMYFIGLNKYWRRKVREIVINRVNIFVKR
ncbi:MAG TPA: oligosaccharide flippase family protein [Salinivirgaceae bacterium]|nr:oligosaccharide flippase family protein [Salinivirgaceae bacterium]